MILSMHCFIQTTCLFRFVGDAQFAISIPQLSMSNPMSSQQLNQSQALGNLVTNTTAVSSLMVATEPSRAQLANAAISPISDDSVPSPEGTPDGLVLEADASMPTTASLNSMNLLQQDPLSGVLSTTPLLASMHPGGAYIGGEHMAAMAVDNWQNFNQMQHLQPVSISDLSLPSGLQPLQSLSTPSSGNMNMGIPFAMNTGTNDLLNQFIVTSGENLVMAQSGMQTSIPASHSLQLVGTEVSTPTQDESPEKSVRPIDILSQLLSKNKKSKGENDSQASEEKAGHPSKKSRDHGRSGSRRSSSGKRRSSHKHHSSEHKESSHDHTDSGRSSSRNKDKSHSSHRSSRSQSKSKESASRTDFSDEDTCSTYIEQSEDSMQSQPKLPRLQSIEEPNSFEQENSIASVVLESAQTIGQENALQNRQPTVFDMRRNSSQQIMPHHAIHDPKSSWSSTDNNAAMNNFHGQDQFPNADMVLRMDNQRAGVPVFVSQNSYQETFLNNCGANEMPVTAQADVFVNSGLPMTISATQETSSYFPHKSPTAEVDVFGKSVSGQGHMNHQQAVFDDVPVSQQPSLADSVPIPHFALEIRPQFNQNFSGHPGEEQGFHMNSQPVMQVTNPEEQQLLEQHRPGMQVGGPFRPTIQMERPFLQPQHHPFQSEQQIFHPEESVVNPEITRFSSPDAQLRPGTESIRPDSSLASSGPGPMLRPKGPRFQQDNSNFREERPLFRAERPHMRSERPRFRGPRPMIRRGGPSHFQGEVQQSSPRQQGLLQSPGFENQAAENFEFQRNSMDNDGSNYDSNYEQNPNHNHDDVTEDGGFQEDFQEDYMMHDHYGSEHDFASQDRNFIKPMEGNRALSGNMNHMHMRHQRPRLIQRGYRRGDMLHPNDFHARGRFRFHEPGGHVRGGNRPQPRMGGNFISRPRFRPPFRPRLPQAFSPRRPVF